MSLVLARVDQRLIHGQVLVGWVPVVRAEEVVVADDETAADEWAAEMMVDAAEPVIPARVLPVAEAADPSLYRGDRRTVLLTRTLGGMAVLAEGGVPLTEINLGGLHYRQNARRLLDYVYLLPEDVLALKDLAGRGIRLIARDVPSSEAVDVGSLLARGRVEYDALPAT